VPGTIPIASIVADSAETTGLRWAAPAAGGAFTLLSTTTCSGVTTVSSINQTYKHLFIDIQQIAGVGTLYFQPNGNSALITYARIGFNPGSGMYNSGQQNNQDLVGSSLSGSSNAFMIWIYDYANTSNAKVMHWDAQFQDQDPCAVMGVGKINTTSAISSFSISGTGAGLSAGTIKVYGVN
jgi:hypothetical protein